MKLPVYTQQPLLVKNYMYVSLSRSWLGWLPFFSFLFSYASVLNTYFHVQVAPGSILLSCCVYVCEEFCLCSVSSLCSVVHYACDSCVQRSD